MAHPPCQVDYIKLYPCFFCGIGRVHPLNPTYNSGERSYLASGMKHQVAIFIRFPNRTAIKIYELYLTSIFSIHSCSMRMMFLLGFRSLLLADKRRRPHNKLRCPWVTKSDEIQRPGDWGVQPSGSMGRSIWWYRRLPSMVFVGEFYGWWISSGVICNLQLDMGVSINGWFLDEYTMRNNRGIISDNIWFYIWLMVMVDEYYIWSYLIDGD